MSCRDLRSKGQITGREAKLKEPEFWLADCTEQSVNVLGDHPWGKDKTSQY